MLIKNARDYEGRICDYLIADGKIRAIGTDLPEAGEVINAKGLTILPAFIDTHCHWRTPGFEYKEDIASSGRVYLREPDAQHQAGLLFGRDRA